MGCDAHVMIWMARSSLDRAESLLDDAQLELERLEALWSRFRCDSDVSRVNATAGEPVTVARETVDILMAAERARVASAGMFDITQLRELEATGYDRTFESIERHVPRGPSNLVVRAAHVAAEGARFQPVTVDEAANQARVDPGRGIDLGGIGKGRAADLVTALLLGNGAMGACVNLGGDLRVLGETPEESGIVIGVEDPLDPPSELSRIEVRNAGVATSASTRRCWLTSTGPAHHILDPRTGSPASTPWASATVIAGSAMWADVLAKTLLLGADPVDPDSGMHITVPHVLVGHDGRHVRGGGFEEFER